MDVISFFPIVVHEFVLSVLRLALEVVPVIQLWSGAQRSRISAAAAAAEWAQIWTAARVVCHDWRLTTTAVTLTPAEHRARRSTDSVTAPPGLLSSWRGFVFLFAEQAFGALWSRVQKIEPVHVHLPRWVVCVQVFEHVSDEALRQVIALLGGKSVGASGLSFFFLLLFNDRLWQVHLS